MGKIFMDSDKSIKVFANSIHNMEVSPIENYMPPLKQGPKSIYSVGPNLQDHLLLTTTTCLHDKAAVMTIHLSSKI